MNKSEYENMFRAEDIHWWYRGLRKLVRDALPHGRNLRILDIGCGTGATLTMLSENHHAYGLDYSPLAIQRCRRRGLSTLAQGDALALPYPSDTFDAIVMLDLLYHSQVPDHTAALREAARVLAPGARIVINVPAYQWLYSSHDAAIHTGHRFTRSEIRALLHQAGLKPTRISYWNTFLFPAILMVRTLRRLSPERGSDIEGYTEGLTGRIFGAILTAERAALKLSTLPFGLSILAVAEKAAD